jgi:hypothetical protein
MRTEQRTTMEQLYQHMVERVLVLTDFPSHHETVPIFISALKDEKVCMEVTRAKPTTLDEACRCAMESRTLMRSVGADRRHPTVHGTPLHPTQHHCVPLHPTQSPMPN